MYLTCHTKKLEDIYLVNKIKKTIMRIKNDFVLREMCGENVIMCEGLKAIDFRKILALNKRLHGFGKRRRHRATSP